MKKMDIRIRFTKKAFKDSLIELMKTTPIRDISIKALCAGAGVSRSTFYVYYGNQYELLEDIQNEIFASYEDVELKHIQGPNLQEFRSIIEDRLRYIASNQDSIQVLLSENGDINFQKKFFEQFSTTIKKTMTHTFEESMDEETERCYSIFFVNGNIALLQDWIKHGMDIPVSKMAEVYAKIGNIVLQ